MQLYQVTTLQYQYISVNLKASAGRQPKLKESCMIVNLRDVEHLLSLKDEGMHIQCYKGILALSRGL